MAGAVTQELDLQLPADSPPRAPALLRPTRAPRPDLFHELTVKKLK